MQLEDPAAHEPANVTGRLLVPYFQKRAAPPRTAFFHLVVAAADVPLRS